MTLRGIYESYFGRKSGWLWAAFTVCAGAMPLSYVRERHWLLSTI